MTALGPKGLSEVDLDQQEIIINCFQENPVLKEFNTLNQTLRDRRFLSKYIMDEQLKVYYPTRRVKKLLV